MLAIDESRAENIRLLKDSAAFFAAPERIATLRTLRGTLPGFAPEDWQRAAELGWFAMRIPEEQGGIGFGVQELCVLAEQLGMGLAPAPIIQAISVAPLLPDNIAEKVIAGEIVVLPAWQDDNDANAAAGPTIFSDGVVTGAKHYVLMGGAANYFVVETNSGLALVDRDAVGVSVATDLLQDGGHFGTIGFEGASALALPGAFAAVREEITLALSAYLLGVSRRCFAITADYLGVRQQFGKAIGSFQSLQHRMVDLYIQIELAAASIQTAAMALERQDDLGTAQLAISRAKARASDAAMLVTRQGVQLHGGIGYTDDCDVGLYLRKAMVLAHFHGSPAQHRARFLRLTEGNRK